MKRLLPIVLFALLIAGLFAAPSAQAVLPQASAAQIQPGVGIYRADHIQVGDEVFQVNSPTSSYPTDERMFTTTPTAQQGYPFIAMASKIVVYNGQLYFVPMIYPLFAANESIIIRTDVATPIDFTNWQKNLDAANSKVEAEKKAGTW